MPASRTRRRLDTARASRPSAARRDTALRGTRVPPPRAGGARSSRRSPGEQALPREVDAVVDGLVGRVECAVHRGRGRDAQLARVLVGAGAHRSGAAHGALLPFEFARAESLLAILVGRRIVRGGEPARVVEILVLAESLAPRLRAFAHG